MELNMSETLFPLPEAKPEPPPSESPARGKPRLLRANRQQVAIRLASLDELLPAEHRARLVWEMVQSYDLSAFYAQIEAVEGEPGHPAIDPALLLAVWLYATLEGVGSARALDRLCGEHLAYQWLLGGVSVNYHTLADFRVEREQALDELLTHSVAALLSEGLVDLERTAQDGVRLRASAGASSFRKADTLTDCLRQAEARVQHLKTQGAASDGPAPTPRQAAARERAARERLARVQQALKAVAELEAAKAKRREKKRQARVVRASTTDPEARVTKMPAGGFRPAFSGQLSIDMGSRIIVGVDVSNTADPQQLEPMLDQTQTRYAQLPDEHYVDGGFRTHAGITAAGQRGVTLYTPIPRQFSVHSARPPTEILPTDTPQVAEWKQRMQTGEAKAKYKGRAATVEWANALLRQRGLQRLLVRGLGKARAVLLWFVLAHNLVQTGNLRRQRVSATP
jgi:transposase